jgi:hypothetical protein
MTPKSEVLIMWIPSSDGRAILTQKYMETPHRDRNSTNPQLPAHIFDCLAQLVNVTMDAVFCQVKVVIDTIGVEVGSVGGRDGGEVAIDLVVLEAEARWRSSVWW